MKLHIKYKTAVRIFAFVMAIFLIGAPVAAYATESSDGAENVLNEQTGETTADAAALPKEALKGEELISALEGFVEAEKANIAGGSVTVFEQDEILFDTDFGYADIAANLAVNDDTVFEWGDASRLLIWISIMQLVEDGKIDLQVPVADYIKDENFAKAFTGTGITVENLVNYNAGFQENVAEKMVPEGAEYDSFEAVLMRTKPKQIFRAGSVVADSEWTAALAAYVVEQVSGVSYAEYVKENIFTPLGMEHTALYPGYNVIDNEWVETQRKLVKGYQGTTLIENSRYFIPMYPVGMVTGTQKDLCTLMMALADTKESKLFDSAQSAEEFLSPSLYYPGTELGRKSYGFWIFEQATPVLGLNASSYSNTCYLYLDPESGLGLTYMTNSYHESKLGVSLIEALYGTYVGDGSDIPVSLASYEGAYVAGSTIYKGNLSIFSLLKTTSFKALSGTEMGTAMSGDIPFFTAIDSRHVKFYDGTIGFLYTYDDGTPTIMVPNFDYVSTDKAQHIAKIVVLILVVVMYLYSSTAVLIALCKWFMDWMQKAPKDENLKFRKFHVIQCVNFVVFCVFYVFMISSAMGNAALEMINATNMMYWLGCIMSVVYIAFLARTGRRMDVSKAEKICYFVTGVGCLLMVAFASIFQLVF